MIKRFLFSSILISLFQNLFASEIVIAKIPEASGITYSLKSNTLFVVGDEGYIYELNLEGKILREKYIGDYDFEGIDIDEEKNLLLVAVEGKDDIYIFSKDKMELVHKISIKRDFKGIEILKKGDDGLEGIALYNNKIYASNQSYKKYPKEDCSVIVVIDYDLNEKKQKINEIINHGYKDITGLSFHKDILYMVSDDDSKLIKYDIKNKTTIKEIKLSKFNAQEGITFDNNGNLYIADDNGQILKIKDLEL